MKSHLSIPLFGVAALLCQSGCHRKEAPATQPYNTRYVVAEAIPSTRNNAGAAFLGVIRGDPETHLSFKVSGQIAKIGRDADTDDWKQGESVRGGEVLAQIDTANFVNAVAAARARAELARANYVRGTELFAAGNLSQADYDALRSQRDMADADLAQTEQSLRDTTLRAPYDGIVLSRLSRAGEYASPGRPVLMIGDFRRVSLEIGVPDNVVRRIKVGARYEVLVSAYEGAAFSGEISEVGMAADPTSRLFKVVLKIDNADGRLRSGLTATVRFGGADAATEGFLVPLSALVSSPRAGGATAVFVVGDDSRAHAREIGAVEIVGSSLLVRSGLKSGDKIVTRGAGQLTDGIPVRAQPETVSP